MLISDEDCLVSTPFWRIERYQPDIRKDLELAEKAWLMSRAICFDLRRWEPLIPFRCRMLKVKKPKKKRSTSRTRPF